MAFKKFLRNNVYRIFVLVVFPKTVRLKPSFSQHFPDLKKVLLLVFLMPENKNFAVYITAQNHVNTTKKLKKLTPRQTNNCFWFHIFNLSTGFHFQEFHDISTFFDNPPESYKFSTKAIIFNSDGFKKNGIMDFKLFQHVITKLKSHQIPYRFMTDLYLTATCQLIAAKIDPEKDKIISQFHVFEDQTKITELIHYFDGYAIESVQCYKSSKFKFTMTVPDKILITNASHKENVVISDCMSQIQQVFNNYCSSSIVIETHFLKDPFEVTKEIVNQMYEKSVSKYFIIPLCFNIYGITSKSAPSGKEDMLIFTEINTRLPFTKSCIASRFDKTFYLTIKCGLKYQILQKLHEIANNCHKIKLTLSVDVNNFPSINHEPIILPRIQKMPKKLNIEKTEKLPIIGFFDNSSVICLWNENENCYKFLDSWNGKLGKDLFLDFMLPKPRLASSSPEVTLRLGIVYDLIKIMTMPSNEIKVDRNWKFTFTKDVENPVLLEFDTAEDDRKAASPAFLMALMLKQHSKVIRKEIGEKPAKIGFRLFDDFENVEAKKRVEVGLTEACEMLKFKCLFV